MYPLTPLARELLAGPNFAIVATLNSDGSPQQSVVWIRERNGELIFSTAEGRTKPRNLLRDPTISVLLLDGEDPYRYSAIRGTARLESESADELIDDLSHKYRGESWAEKPGVVRVNVVVTPERISEHGA